jgi:hypothetical protein
MKKELLQKISELCRFALDDKQCIKLQTYLIIEDYTSARIYLDKVIELIEWTLAFDENDEVVKKQLIDSNLLMDLVMELTIINEGDKRNEQVRAITQ